MKTTCTKYLGPSGEHLVMAELLRRGYAAGFPPPGTDALDILVHAPACRAIQVKTTANGKGWLLKRKHETPVPGVLFALVDFAPLDQSPPAPANIYLVPSEVVAEEIIKENRAWRDAKPGRADNDIRNLRTVDPKYLGAWNLLDETEQQRAA